MSKSLKNRRILQGSILLSILFHVGEIHFLQRQSLWFSTQSPNEIAVKDWISSMEKQERNQILKESFLSFASESNRSCVQITVATPSPLLIQKPIEQSVYLHHNPTFSLPQSPAEEGPFFSVHSPLPLLDSPISPPLVSNPFANTIPFTPHLPKGFVPSLPKVVAALPLSLPSPLSTHLEAPKELPQENIEIAQPEFLATKPQSHPAALEKKLTLPKAPSPLLASLRKIPSLVDLQTIAYSKSFDTELVFTEQEEGKYIFALTLIPREDLKLTPLKQNYFFLIDRSNSIQGERLQAAKNAVRKAIEELEPEDQFNIIVFDQKIDKLSAKSLPATNESIAKAQGFLEKIELGNFFSQSNLYKPLFLTLPSSIDENELYTAILLSDGESLSQKNMVHNLLNDWTRMNQGKVSLFTIGMNEDTNLETLNIIASFNRGKTLSSPTKRGLKRKLLKLMRTIHSPLAKNLCCKAISRNPHENIELFPKTNHAPHLFLNEPYVILGTTNSLNDFVLFVQGRLNGEWLHIKKNISFLNAKKGSPSLISEWAIQKAFTLYQEYQQNEDVGYLAEAQNLLKSHDLQEILNLK